MWSNGISCKDNQCMCDQDQDGNHDTGAKLEAMGWQGTCSCNLICRWPDGTSNGQGTNMCATKCCNDVSWYKENMKPDEYFHPTDPSRRCCKGPNCRESKPKPSLPNPQKAGELQLNLENAVLDVSKEME